MDAAQTSREPERVQLHLVLPYKLQPREHPLVSRHLASGYRIAQLQRVSDQEVLVTLMRLPGEGPGR